MELVLAGVCFAAALACSAGGWRALLPDGVSIVQACARFGCGSLANTDPAATMALQNARDVFAPAAAYSDKKKFRKGTA